MYSTPRRVFFSLPGTNLQLCDYMFQDEKLLEVKGRVLELLDLTLEEDDLDISFEKPASKDLTILSHTIFVSKDEKQKMIINF